MVADTQRFWLATTAFESSKLRMLIAGLLLTMTSLASADPPHVSYIFPAGGQRGTTVSFKVGGHFLHEGCPFEMIGSGVKASERIERTATVWFEGPVIPQPASQQKEDYPKDYAGTVAIAADAEAGVRYWRVKTSQGATARMKFEIGDLPEMIEDEIDGTSLPVAVSLPITINGRIFPREDIDEWAFDAQAGQIVSCAVSASRLGSGLDAVLEVVGPNGQMLAINDDDSGDDPAVRFVAPSTGRYVCRIRDAAFGGLQHYVYRLSLRIGPVVESVFPLGGQRGADTAFQLTGLGVSDQSVSFSIPKDAGSVVSWQPPGTQSRLWLPVSDLSEQVENEVANNDLKEAASLALSPVSSVLNGRIDRPGDADLWKFSAKKDQTLRFEVFAARLSSPLDSVLSIISADGKEVANNDDLIAGEADSRLVWKAPQDGEWFLKICDQLASRGGPRFGYRIEVREQSRPDFELQLAAESLIVERGGKDVRLKVTVDRSAGFQDSIELVVDGLPSGVTVTGTKIDKGRNDAQLTFKAEEHAPVQVASLTISGKGGAAENEIVRKAGFPMPFPEQPMMDVALAVAMKTPFKFTVPFETKYVARGTVYARKYVLDRGGFDGPIEIELADRQNRHLQGVTGPKIVVPPGVSEFEYPVTLPPWMEIGRTSRSCLMASAFLKDEAGQTHRVSFSSQEQNDQIVIIVDPVRLSVDTAQKTVERKPGATLTIPVTVQRGTGLKGPVALRIHAAEHVRGWKSDEIMISEGSSSAVLHLQFEAGFAGPFNAPLIIEARMADEHGQPVLAVCPIQVRE